ncbi:flagellar hook-associated protein 2 [Thalassotalea insulae]|uniref:Flagellar hook-associated protein 2 n=1 Tax=Thalassotalea insulae TaxID=2056778 RepID=A0ABQ6GNS4_9GAMM|nr:flagellar filament capping protein FliD [Thalassotalea insulae]GLX77648.1 flagellar hook-associated protein 2 [Thalassotalea insulae]
MATITALGIGSGLDLEGIVEAYVNSVAIPEEIRLQEKEERLGLELSGVGSFKSALSSFDDILSRLAEDDAFSKQILTSSSSAVEVTSNGFASNGSFSIDVEQLAQSNKYNSTVFAGGSSSTVGSGNLTFGNGTDSFVVAIDAADSLSDIRDKINSASDNFGVNVNIVNGDTGSFLVFGNENTGVDNRLTISTDDASLDNISTNNTEVQLAQDAKIIIDGTTTAYSGTNEFKNIIEDLTINVSEKTVAGSPATITIEQDVESGEELIDEFIKGYNAVFDSLTGLGAPEQGRLAFDPNVRQVKQGLANMVIESISGLTGSIDSLRDIGLEVNKDGYLEKSTFSSPNIPTGSERLNNALSTQLEDVAEFFSSSNGLAQQMSDYLGTFIDSDGVLTQRQTSLNEQISEIPDEWQALEDKLRNYESTLRSQFTYLDSVVSQFNATSAFLTSSLANINGSGGKE